MSSDVARRSASAAFVVSVALHTALAALVLVETPPLPRSLLVFAALLALALAAVEAATAGWRPLVARVLLGTWAVVVIVAWAGVGERASRAA